MKKKKEKKRLDIVQVKVRVRSSMTDIQQILLILKSVEFRDQYQASSDTQNFSDD